MDELQSGDVVAVVGAGHVPGMKRFWEYRQQRIREEGGIPEAESQQLHHDLQLFPGMELPDGGVYTKKMLRYSNRRCSCSSVICCVSESQNLICSIARFALVLHREHVASAISKR